MAVKRHPVRYEPGCGVSNVARLLPYVVEQIIAAAAEPPLLFGGLA